MINPPNTPPGRKTKIMAGTEIKAGQAMELRLIVREAVEETLQKLGFDTSKPSELQADMLYLRKLRRGAEDAHRVVFKVLFSILLTALLYTLWDGIMEKFK